MVRKSVIDGGWIDLGGQSIGPTQSNILSLAESLGIKHFDSYETGRTVVNYGGAVSTIDDSFPDRRPALGLATPRQLKRTGCGPVPLSGRNGEP